MPSSSAKSESVVCNSPHKFCNVVNIVSSVRKFAKSVSPDTASTTCCKPSFVSKSAGFRDKLCNTESSSSSVTESSSAVSESILSAASSTFLPAFFSAASPALFTASCTFRCLAEIPVFRFSVRFCAAETIFPSSVPLSFFWFLKISEKLPAASCVFDFFWVCAPGTIPFTLLFTGILVTFSPPFLNFQST